jgi:hypothetical protein
VNDVIRPSEEKDLCPAWRAAPLQQRLIACRIMLYQHGLLTDAEMERVDRRLDKRFPVATVARPTYVEDHEDGTD